MPNAIAMADYAHCFAGRLKQGEWLGAARDVASANTAPDEGLIVHSSGAYFTLINAATASHRDSTCGGVDVRVSGFPGRIGIIYMAV